MGIDSINNYSSNFYNTQNDKPPSPPPELQKPVEEMVNNEITIQGLSALNAAISLMIKETKDPSAQQSLQSTYDANCLQMNDLTAANEQLGSQYQIQNLSVDDKTGSISFTHDGKSYSFQIGGINS